MPFNPLTNQYLNAFSLSKNEFEKKTSANICLLVKYQCFICYIVSVEMAYHNSQVHRETSDLIKFQHFINYIQHFLQRYLKTKFSKEQQPLCVYQAILLYIYISNCKNSIDTHLNQYLQKINPFEHCVHLQRVKIPVILGRVIFKYPAVIYKHGQSHG